MRGKLLRQIVALAVIATPVWAAPGSKSSPKPEPDLKKMEGTWLYITQTIGGLSLDEDDRSRIWVEINGDVMIKAGVAGSELKYKIVLDPKAKPKTIDLVSYQDPSGKTFFQKGIYEWDGETLRFCFDNTGKERPKEFKSPDGKDNIYMSVLKRKEK